MDWEEQFLNYYHRSNFTIFHLHSLLNNSGRIPLTNSTEIIYHSSTQDEIILYCAPILLLLGFLGSSMSVLVMRKFACKLSTYLYLMVLALMDILVLFVGLLPRWIEQMTNNNMFNESRFACKFGNFLAYFSSHASVWITVFVAFERLLTIYRPKAAARLCKLKSAITTIAAICVTLGVFNIHFFWSVDIGTDEFTNEPVCQEISPLVVSILPWIDGVIYFATPFCIMLIMACILTYIVKKSSLKPLTYTQRSRNFAVDDQRKPVSKKNKRLTLMLLSVSFTYLLSTLPMVVVILLYTSQQPMSHDGDNSMMRKARALAEFFMYTNHAVHFFLYCAVSKEFRIQFTRIMLCKRTHEGSLIFDVRTRTFSFSTESSRRSSLLIQII